jgi:hypothetical protein
MFCFVKCLWDWLGSKFCDTKHLDYCVMTRDTVLFSKQVPMFGGNCRIFMLGEMETGLPETSVYMSTKTHGVMF